MKIIDYNGSLWIVRAIIDDTRIDDPKKTKKSFGYDLCLYKRGEYWFLEKIIDAEWEEIPS